MVDCSCLISPLQEFGKYILTEWAWPFLKPHVLYWWHFDNNIQGLREEVERLDHQIRYLQQKVEGAGPGTENHIARVGEWLVRASEKLEEGRRIYGNIPGAWNMTSRYSIGKEAKKTAEEIANLRKDGNFNMIPPMEFKSRKLIEEGIVDCLNKITVGMIVICGMGGVGKTTVAKRIRETVKEENLFNEDVMVTVSQNINIPKIQNEIAELLHLKFDGDTIPRRAEQLCARLTDVKTKLIILDDVWGNFESQHFKDVGIPIESKMCKILLTSRDADVCKEIKSRKVFEVKILQDDEAWLLFKDKAGEWVEGVQVARDVAAECKCLPIALVTVGVTLGVRRDICIWENKLSQLRESNPEDFPELVRKVYNPIKLSYDFLDSDRERSLFLLCCLFPEDFNISVEQLSWYSMGLGLFDFKNIKEARNRTHTLIGNLKSRFLLIDVEEEEELREKGLEVKMHDVIRDVAIYIGSIEKHGFLKSLTSIENSSDENCNWMSVDISNEQTEVPNEPTEVPNEQMEVPVLPRFPKLLLLMLSSNFSSNKFSDISFKGMEGLKVLSFERISIPSLPPTLALLENLQTLRLFRCEVKNISVIGKLTSLQILSCCECFKINELPAEINRLKDLRLLELNKCPNLRRIPFGIISRLVRLEELKIGRSFKGWEKGEEPRNAALKELDSLSNLTCLEIEISNCTLSAQKIRLSQKLVRYKILIGAAGYSYYLEDYEKVMSLNLTDEVENWIKLLAMNAEFLILSGDKSNKIKLAEMENLRSLEFKKCSTVEKLVNSRDLNQNVSLCNLKSVYISECSNLKHVFSVSVATTRLLQLEFLVIGDCKSMEQVFWNEGTYDHTDGCIEFPKLKVLRLWNLPNLTAFCQGLESITIKFPKLIELEIKDLPKLNSLLFCNPKDVSFCNLKSINISQCHNLRYLFSVSVARRCLLQLEVLKIEDCEKMEQLFCNEGPDNSTDGCIEFSKLKQLILRNLPNLTAYWQGLENIIIKFPNLTEMSIEGLPKLYRLFPLNSETVENTCFHLFCNCNPKVEMGGLKILTLFGSNDTNIRNMWCSQISNNGFNNLETLHISFINGIRSLMSTSIAKKLVSLKCLTIESCRDMVEVIERDDDDKQVVDIKCLFPNLKSLDLRNMLKLRWFWQWSHALELPLLEKICIFHCTVMETFTLGSINTPNMRMINVNHERTYHQKELNDVIRHIWTESQNKFKTP